jgi:hypothetical protein
VGHEVGRGTIANVLHEHGIEPAPERDRYTRWSTFLKAHWECLTATDFLSVEVHTLNGLVTYYLLFFIDIASRPVHAAGITPRPGASAPAARWNAQLLPPRSRLASVDPLSGHYGGNQQSHNAGETFRRGVK